MFGEAALGLVAMEGKEWIEKGNENQIAAIWEAFNSYFTYSILSVFRVIKVNSYFLFL